MEILHSLILGVVQGLTELLPVSSSAHLNLFPWVFGWSDISESFDVALHIGTLLAIIIFFYKDYSVKFWSAEEERPHVHAIGTDAEVKFWLDPDGVHIAEVKGKINNAELNQLLKEIRKHESECLNQWREYFGN